MFNNSSLYGGPKSKGFPVKCDCASKTTTTRPQYETLMSGSCTMTTATKSDDTECKWALRHEVSTPRSMMLCIFSSVGGQNTGDDYPATDGWVLHDFRPEVPPVFPMGATAGQWRTLIVPHFVPTYVTLDAQSKETQGVWLATFHPEEAICLALRTGDMDIKSGAQWKWNKTIEFPVDCV